MRILAIVTIIVTIATLGCGLAIHFGGGAFKSGVKGHVVLGILTALCSIGLASLVLINRR